MPVHVAGIDIWELDTFCLGRALYICLYESILSVVGKGIAQLLLDLSAGFWSVCHKPIGGLCEGF